MLSPDAVVELVWQDASGSTAVTLLHASSSLTVTEIDANATALASLLVPLTDATLIKQRIKYVNRPAERPVPASDTPIHEQAIFIFTTFDDLPMAVISIPSIKESIMLTDGFGAGFIVDLSLTAVSEFIDDCISLPLCNPFGAESEVILSAYRLSRV